MCATVTAILQIPAHLALKGNGSWHPDWLDLCYAQNTTRHYERVSMQPFFAMRLALCETDLDTR